MDLIYRNFDFLSILPAGLSLVGSFGFRVGGTDTGGRSGF
jgi:hypothetical protein